jgi:hypothetical protein
MTMLLKSLIAAGFPALVFPSSVYGHRAEMPVIWHVGLYLSAVGVALSGRLGWKESADFPVTNHPLNALRQPK